MKKVIKEELDRIHEVMYGRPILKENFLATMTRRMVADTVADSIKRTMDDFIKKAIAQGTKNALDDARYVIDDIIKGGSAQARSVANTANKIYDDVARAAYGQSYKQLDDNLKLQVRNSVDNVLSETDDTVKRFAKDASDDLDNVIGKNKPQPKPSPDPNPKPQPKPSPDPVKPTWYNKTWTWLTKTRWGKIVLGAATIGGAYLIWKSFFDSDGEDLPPCLKKLVENEAEFEKFLNDRYIEMQGYKFFEDGNVESASGSGEWSYDESTSTITITINGEETSIPCEGVLPEPKECPEGYELDPNTNECVKSGGGGGGGGGGGSYNECNDFPLIQGCKGQKVKDIQECLGGLTVDGLWGNKTQSKVESSGYGSDGISEEEYNKIMEKCGKVQTEPKPDKDKPQDFYYDTKSEI